MKKNRKLRMKGLSLFLALVMCSGMLQFTAFAAENDESETSSPATEPEITVVTVDVSTYADEDGTSANETESDVQDDNTENPETTEPVNQDNAEVDESDAWDISKTERPEASDTVTAGTGTSADKANTSGEGKNWSIFYDADNDVYKVTFNIDKDADDTTQVIDLTQALELLGQYAESGKQELQAAIDGLEKPVMGEPSIAKPVEPGKPENLDENVDKAYSNIIASVPRDDEGEPAESFDYAGAIAEVTGLDKDSDYVKDMASYMYDQAMVDWCMSSWDKWEAEGHPYANYFGDPDTFLYFGCGITVKWPDGYNKGTPVLKKSAPEYQIDKTTEEYKAYEQAMDNYNAALAVIEAKYAKDKAAYDAAVAQLEADFDRRVNAINADMLESIFDRRVEANVLEPGDIKKFELFLTSDSKHTYKYVNGSFTLATPGWSVDGDGNVVGFDGQILPDEYIDRNSYRVSVTAEPIQALLKELGVDDPKHPNNYWMVDANGKVQVGRDGDGNINDYNTGRWDPEIEKALAEYPGETLAEQLNSYILAYYGNEYDSIDALVVGNPKAAAELTKTITSGNKWFSIGGEEFVVQAHTATVKYDSFYKNLFSFAFGDKEQIDKLLGTPKFNEGTNRWEYENKSWTNNDYELALYYYMDHKEIWKETDAYFSTLLKDGLSVEQATWTSLMMALNIDGVLTGNDWQNTRWPWYNSITLERMDIDFSLTKTDRDTDEPITDSQTGFNVYYIKDVENEGGTITHVNMYVTPVIDEDGKTVSYTFSETASTLWTDENGQLNINYTLMKDIVYYLQEVVAPEGYQIDDTIYVITDQKTYNKLVEEGAIHEEDGYALFGGTGVDLNTLSASGNITNAKIVITPKPEDPPTPENPPKDPPKDPPEEPEIPDEDVPLSDIPDEDVPLSDIPDEEIDIPDEDVPLSEVPMTGDEPIVLYGAALFGLCGLFFIRLRKSAK